MNTYAKFYRSFGRLEINTKKFKKFFIVWHWNEFLIGVKIYRSFCHLSLGFLTFGAIWATGEMK